MRSLSSSLRVLLWTALCALLLSGGGSSVIAGAAMKAIPVIDDLTPPPPVQTSAQLHANAEGRKHQTVHHAAHHAAAGAGTYRRHGAKYCPPGAVLRVTWTAGEKGDGKIYGSTHGLGIWSVLEEDVFEYEVMWREPDCNCGVDFEAGTSYRHRDHGGNDDRGYSPHSEKNLKMGPLVAKQWMRRRWTMAGTQAVGKYVDRWVVSAALKPGQRRTAYFRYIRVAGISGGEPNIRKTIFDDGSEAFTMLPYMAGTIETECQDEITLEAASTGISSAVWTGGKVEILAGVIDATRLDDEDTPNGTCTIGAEHPFRSFAALATAPRRGVEVLHMHVRVRHPTHAEVIVWDVLEVDCKAEPRTVPMPFWVPLHVPPTTALSAVLNGTVAEVVVRYRLAGSTEEKSATLFTQRIQLR